MLGTCVCHHQPGLKSGTELCRQASRTFWKAENGDVNCAFRDLALLCTSLCRTSIRKSSTQVLKTARMGTHKVTRSHSHCSAFKARSYHSLSQLTSILALAVLSLNFIYLLFIGQSRHSQHTCGQRQLWRAGLLLQSRVWGLNSGHQVWQQAPYQLSHLRRFSCTSHLGSSYSISYHQLLTCLSFRYVWVPTCQSLAGRRNPNWIKSKTGCG